MKKQDVLGLSAMPLQSPTFPRGPYKFHDRQYMVITYITDRDAIRAALPEPLEPAGDTVSVQWLDLPDGEGLGAYAATSQVIPCVYQGKLCNFISQMYVDNTSPLAGGREIWGYPMKYGKSVLKTATDTLTGTLHYAGQQVATGTMVYKHDNQVPDATKEGHHLARPQITLKLIPDIDGKPAIAQLVSVEFQEVKVKGAWQGPARLELIPSVNCPLADLPVRGITGGLHLVTDMVLPYGKVIHDYLA